MAEQTPEQIAAAEAAEKKAAEAAEKKRLEEHMKAESGNWVTVEKGSEQLQINRTTVAAHLAAGWKVAE